MRPSAPGRTPLLLHPHPARSARGQTEEHHLRLPWPHVSPCQRAPAPLPRSQLPRSSCSRCLSALRRGSTAPAVSWTGTRAREAPGPYIAVTAFFAAAPLGLRRWLRPPRFNTTCILYPCQVPPGAWSADHWSLRSTRPRPLPSPRPQLAHGASCVHFQAKRIFNSSPFGPLLPRPLGPATGAALGTSPSTSNRSADRCAALGPCVC